ncbi:UDP-2,3-diacylglucosamine diphosphatase [Chiayiivirga flava]|uniref:UDP-2,3-diacylglucosamine hydrolase n=1 Tax=Chiayiivirga flava TaxID=659595 RepID=A0A7W8FYE8_9GAMM|nr:UDP-2,3-diacylglucosamine diphosphatase [Chiayiivirga flava]MBB5207322.1 UDP-2,3-diacylglucosamine hydrolase [Chiayiivirga flava]
MTTLFISDLHLDADRPDITALFVDFLAHEAAHVDALFVLGDLFEVWIGDDDDAPLAREVARSLRTVAAHGVPVSFIRGNRDFLLGRDYAEQAGFALLPDPCVVSLYGEAVLLLHGDLLCTDDTDYLAVRRQVRDPAWQHALLARSLAERRAFALQARSTSASRQASMALETGDATQTAVDDAFRRFGARRMVHGHTHRPAVHDTTLDGMPRQRIVLGDWYEQGSVLRWERSGEVALSRLG